MTRGVSLLLMLLLAAAMVAGLVTFGWWTVPAVAAGYAAVMRTRRAPFDAMLAALLASVILVARHAMLPAFGRLLTQLGGLFPMSGIAVAGLALLLMMILAFTAARVVTGVAGVRERA